MTTGKLLCDASFERELQLGSYSGGFQLNGESGDWSGMYNGVAPSVKDSNESEMIAVAAGLKSMADRLAAQGEVLSELSIFTDSQTTINQYDLFLNGKQHKSKYSVPLYEIDKYVKQISPNSAPTLNHVKAHVIKAKASPIEKFHNMIDNNAKAVRLQVKKHLFNPNVNAGKYYGITLPSKVSASQVQDMKQLGYFYAKQGFIARVAFVGKVPGSTEGHPFFDGISQAAIEDGKNKTALTNIESWDRIGGRINGAEGMDRTLTYNHYVKRGYNPNNLNFNTPALQYSAVTARAMYGPQSEDYINCSYLTGRTQHASSFMVNTFDKEVIGTSLESRPQTSADWLDVFAKEVAIPLHKGLKNAVELAMIPEHLILEDPAEKVKEALKDLTERYCNVLEPGQIFAKVLATLGEHGVELSKSERYSVQSNVYSLSNSPVGLFNAVTNSAFNNKVKEKTNDFDNREKKPKIAFVSHEQESKQFKPHRQERTISRGGFK